MGKVWSLFLIAIYVFVFLTCDSQIHDVGNSAALSKPVFASLTLIEWICGIGGVMETLELVFGLEIKAKLKESFDEWWESQKDAKTIKSIENKKNSELPISESEGDNLSQNKSD